MSSSTSQQIDDAARQAQKDGQAAAREFEKKAEQFGDDVRKGAKDLEKKASRAAHDAKEEASKFWDTFSKNPEYWASTLAAVNVAVLGGLGVYAYVKRDEIKHTDRRLIGGVVAGVAALLGVQGYAAAEAAKKQKGGKL